jgi:hypothetical protein
MEEMASRYGRWLQIYRISSCRQLKRGDPSALGFGEELATSHCNIMDSYEMLHTSSELDRFFEMT